MIGRTISHYQIEEKLGEGGMGVVYKAVDTRLNRPVALKFLSSRLLGDPEEKIRLTREAQAAAVLEHSSICTIHEIDECDGDTFIAMAYIEGTNLDRKIRSGPLEVREAVGIAIQIADGLQEAHDKGLLHRDIKPANIMVTPRGHAKIMDFGLAKLADRRRITREGETVGTVAYMSPEQTRSGGVDAQTDVWALGVTLYEMVTGRLPFRGDYGPAVIYSILNEDPEPLTQHRPDAPARLELIVQKALTKERADRYSSAAEMLADLKALRAQMDSDRYEHSREIESLGRRRKRLLLGAIGAPLLLILLVVVGVTIEKGRRNGIPRGEPRQVTRGGDFEFTPALSPDGRRIAFASEREENLDIYVIDARGGSPLRLTEDPAADRDPVWFPDGASIAFVSDRGGGVGVWKVGQFGGGATLLLEDAFYPAISPDGERLAFSRLMPSGEVFIGIYSLAGDGGERLITGPGEGIWVHKQPAWSPDGRRICYATAHDLWVVPAQGGAAQPLTTGGRFDSEPAWSPGGKRIYFSSWREGTLALWAADAGGGGAVRLTMGTGPESHPTVSRDGSRLVYTTTIISAELVLLDRVSGGEVVLSGVGDDPCFALAPDKSRIVYTAERWGAGIELWSQALEDGIPVGEPKRMTEQPGDASHPVFSPDGEWIAYYRIEGNERDVWIIPASGGSPRRITDHPGSDSHPAWSPDGEMLAFVSDRNEHRSSVWVLPVRDGKRAGPPRPLTGAGVTAFAPAWCPDGSAIAFVGPGENQWEVWAVPLDGGEAHPVTRGAGAFRVRYDPGSDHLLVSGNWGEDRRTLRTVSCASGQPMDEKPLVLFGGAGADAFFDISSDGALIAFVRQSDSEGDIWLLEATPETF